MTSLLKLLFILQKTKYKILSIDKIDTDLIINPLIFFDTIQIKEFKNDYPAGSWVLLIIK